MNDGPLPGRACAMARSATECILKKSIPLTTSVGMLYARAFFASDFSALDRLTLVPMA